MTHTQHGSIAGDTETGGILDPTGCVLFDSVATLAIALNSAEGQAAVALSVSGRVNKTQDTVETVFLMAPEDAGVIAGGLADACFRALGKEGVETFNRGLEQGIRMGKAS